MQNTKDHLGKVSERYETSGTGPETISNAKGDHGGISYGIYQLSTHSGTLREYLAQSVYKKHFESLEPATPAFDKRWIELAKNDSSFGSDQRNYIKTTHYDVQVDRLKAHGLDLSDRGEAVQEALWSTAIQYRGLTQKVFKNGLLEKFGADYHLGSLSDRDIVDAVQDYKIVHNHSLFASSPKLWSRLHDRALEEKEDLIALAEGRPLVERSQATHSKLEHRALLKQGMHGDDVRHVQEELHELGYLRAEPNGRFGPATNAAVKDFQEDQGLTVDGKVGKETHHHLDDAVHDRQAGQTAIGPITPLAEPMLRSFSDPAHPQHALYCTLRENLPQGTSDERLAQSTAACYMSGMKKPEDLCSIYIGDRSVTFTSSSLFALPAHIDIGQPAPQVQQSMQSVQQHDGQQAQLAQDQSRQSQIQQTQSARPAPGGLLH